MKIKILILILCVFLIPISAFGATYYSEAGGGDGSACNSTLALSTISYTFSSASSEVWISGTVTNPLTIAADGVTLNFCDGAEIALSAAVLTSGTKYAAIYATGRDNITIDGKTDGEIYLIDNGSPSYTSPDVAYDYQVAAVGVYLNTCDGATVKNLTVSGIYRYSGVYDMAEDWFMVQPKTSCIYSLKGSNVTISNNTLSDANVPLWIATASGVSISGIEVSDNIIGESSWMNMAVTTASDGVTMSNVKIHDNTFGDSTSTNTYLTQYTIPIDAGFSGTPPSPGDTVTCAAKGFSGTVQYFENDASPRIRMAAYTGTLPVSEDIVVGPSSFSSTVSGSATEDHYHHNHVFFFTDATPTVAGGYFYDVYVYNNDFTGVLGPTVTAALGFSYKSLSVPIDGMYIFNNVFYSDSSAYMNGLIRFSMYAGTTTTAYIYNNTFDSDGVTEPSAIYAASDILNLYIKNNIVSNMKWFINALANESAVMTIVSDYNDFLISGSGTGMVIIGEDILPIKAGFTGTLAAGDTVTSSGFSGTVGYFYSDVPAIGIVTYTGALPTTDAVVVKGEDFSGVMSSPATTDNWATLTTWKNATSIIHSVSGNDANSYAVDPALNGTTHKMTASTPASLQNVPNLGEFVAGLSATTSDKDGVARGATWDMGAYEYITGDTYPSAAIGSGASMSIGSGAVMTLQ